LARDQKSLATPGINVCLVYGLVLSLFNYCKSEFSWDKIWYLVLIVITAVLLGKCLYQQALKIYASLAFTYKLKGLNLLMIKCLEIMLITYELSKLPAVNDERVELRLDVWVWTPPPLRRGRFAAVAVAMALRHSVLKKIWESFCQFSIHNLLKKPHGRSQTTFYQAGQKFPGVGQKNIIFSLKNTK